MSDHATDRLRSPIVTEPIDLDAARARLTCASADTPRAQLVVDDDVAPHLAALHRTEDIAIAPDGRRALIPSFHGDFFVVVDLDVDRTDSVPALRVSNGTVVQSVSLSYPHGVTFIDESTVLIANRGSELMVMSVPPRTSSLSVVSRAPKVVVGHDDPVPVRGPGSVVVRVRDLLCEVFVCNNHGHDVTRYVLDRSADLAVIDREVLIGSGLSTPDGIAISDSGRWLAVSNHDTHEVFVYAYDPGAARPTELAGVLRGANYPHGLEFADDDRVLLLNDAGLPYLHVYAAPDSDWSGERSPLRSVRVMDDTTFNLGRYNPQEGGPKGLAVLHDQRAVVVTSTYQRLCCLLLDDLVAGMPHAPAGATHDPVLRSDPAVDVALRSTARAGVLEAELAAMRERCEAMEARIAVGEEELAAAHTTADELRAEIEAVRAASDVLFVEAADRHAANERAAAAEQRATAIEQSTFWRTSRPARAALDKLRRR